MSLFYKLPKDIAPLIQDCINSAENIVCDQLDCSVSARRQPTDKTMEEIIAMDTIRFNFIFRPYQNIYQFVAATFNCSTDYFVWIDIPPLKGDKIINKYNLKPINNHIL